MARVTPINKAWKDCPRADECSVNDCPLTTKRYISDSSDPQIKCTFGKIGRLRIGKKWGLENLGFKPRELASKKKWDNLPEKEKLERIANLKRNSPIVRLSDKGYAIVPKKKIKSETQGLNSKKSLKTGSEGEVQDEL
jgi:hypothetical protein